jgi:hypothetical protein
MMMMQTDFTGWEFHDVFDNVPMPGAFVSPTRQDIPVHVGQRTIVVNALNWNHAVVLAYRQAAEENNQQLDKCCVCGAKLRYAALFFKGDALFVVGQECAQRVEAGCSDREEWQIALALKDMKSIQTKNGPRLTIQLQEPANFKLIPYAERPKFVSTWTPKGPVIRGRQTFGKPRLTVWAETPDEMLTNVRELRNFLRTKNVNLAQRLKPRFAGMRY